VLPLALDLLGEEAGKGSVLFVNDGFEQADLEPLDQFAAQPGSPGLTALVVGTNEGGVSLTPDGSPVTTGRGQRLDTRIDSTLLRQVENAADLTIVRMQTGDGDLRALLRAITSHLTRADDPDAQWREQGWWLLWPAALLMLVSFRRGWTMQW
jgi:Ca-activated chloride channel family protein